MLGCRILEGDCSSLIYSRNKDLDTLNPQPLPLPLQHIDIEKIRNRPGERERERWSKIKLVPHSFFIYIQKETVSEEES